MGALSNQLTTKGNCCNQANSDAIPDVPLSRDYLRLGD